MAWSLQWYKNSLLAWMWDVNAQQAVMSETPWFNMFANTNQTNVPWMDILNPTERRNQEYDTNAMRAEALNKEVEIWLWTRVDNVMSDADKQSYLNSLTKNQYNQMLKYKNEWYWFMASKALLENSYKLADPNATWLMKYKDYADKDAYYYNNSSNWVSNFVERYLSNPLWKLSKWWNEDLWFAEDAQRWNVNFADRFANLTIWNIINWLDTAAKGIVWIVDEGESKVKSLYDKVVKWYDTDWDFYDKDREETIVDKIIDTAYGAWESVLWAVWLIPNPVSFWVAAWLSTEPWEKIGWLTIWTISKLVDETLSLPWIRAWYNLLSDDSKDKVSTWLAMIITGKAAKAWGAKLSAKAEPYIRTTKEMVQNWLNKWAEYAKVQADFENFSKTKWRTEREDWTFVETENYNPWYRGRVASEFWEWFKEGVKEKFNNPNWTNLSERGSTPYQEWLQWWEIPTWWENVNKTNANNTQSNWIVNTIWASQLRQRNKMNKVQWIKFANRYWTDYWTWMAQRGFNQSYDNNINQLIDYDKYMQNQKRQALWAITQRYREPAVDDMLLEAINRAEYIKSDDLWKLQNLALKNEQWWLTPADIDYVRQRFWYNFPLRFDGTDIAWTTQRNNNMYMRVKDVLERIADENWIPQLRDINREIAATHHIIEWTTRYYNWIATNDIVSLKDLITLAWTVANPSARPLFVIQQSLKMPKVRDAILGKLIKGKTTEERNQIKIDFDKIRKIQNEAEQRRMLEEWIAKWNLKVEEATKAMQNRLPENITQWGVSAWDRWFMATYWDWPTYWELWLGNIRETASPQYLLRAIIEQLKESNLIKDINTSEAINQILANLSPEAQAKLAQIANKLANWRELTPEEWKVVEKLADIIRQDQDTITDVQQPWLFDWVDQNNKNILYHVTKNNNLTKFEDLNKLREYKLKIEEADEKIKNAPSSLSKEYQDAWQEKMDLIKNMPEWMDVLDQIWQNWSRGWEWIYLTSRPYEWSMTLRDQWIDLWDNVYAIYLPEWVEEYMQTAWNDILLPEAIVDWTKAVVLWKVDIEKWDIEYQANQLLEEYTKNKWRLDNWEPTDINNTNLPTKPTNNGWENGWIVEQGEVKENWVYKPTTWWELDWGRSEETVWEVQSWLWVGNKEIEWEVQEITDISEANDIIDSIWDKSTWWLHMVSPSNWKYRTFVNPEKTAAISIEWDKIIDYVQDNNAPDNAWDQIILKAIEEWANKLDAETLLMAEHFENFWFKPLVRDGNGKYLLAHNWDSVDVVRDNIWKYKTPKLNMLQILKAKWAAEKFRDKFMKDDYWQKLWDIEWWDGLKNYENFDTKFDTESKIKDYLDKSFEYLDSAVPSDMEAIFNKTEAMATQIYNWHISYKDTWLIYENWNGWLKQRYKDVEDGVMWLYSRPKNQLALWVEDWYTAPHETLHLILYKSWLELTWREIELADLASKMIDDGSLRRKEDTVIWKLLWEFADIYKDVKYWSLRDVDVKRIFDYTKYSNNLTKTIEYYKDPSEQMAAFWEAFYEFVQWKDAVSESGIQFPKWLCVRFAKWLGNMDLARVSWELHSWELWTVTHKHLISPYIDWLGTVRNVWELFDKSKPVWSNKSIAVELQERRWYHWSPYSFDKFDSSHMWEWEWAQAHWWGHYIAIEEWTARHYGGMNESNTWWVNFILDGKPYKEVYNTLDEFEKDAFDSFKAYRLNDYEFWEAWDMVKEKSSEDINNRIRQDESFINYLNERMKEKPEEAEQLKNMIEETKKHLEKYKAKKSELSKIDDLRKRSGVDNNLYEVEIPDPIKKDTPTGSNYLEEDGKITYQQVEKIAEWLKDYDARWEWGKSKFLENIIRDLDDAWWEWNDKTNKYEIKWTVTWEKLYRHLSDYLRDIWEESWAKKASEYLESLWYDWIHYFWNRDWEAYVIFNDDAIDIKSHKTL